MYVPFLAGMRLKDRIALDVIYNTSTTSCSKLRDYTRAIYVNRSSSHVHFWTQFGNHRTSIHLFDKNLVQAVYKVPVKVFTLFCNRRVKARRKSAVPPTHKKDAHNKYRWRVDTKLQKQWVPNVDEKMAG